MNIILNNQISQTIVAIILLSLSLTVSFSSNAATFAMEDGFVDEELHLDDEFSNSVLQEEARQKQAIEEVKTNYQFVFELVKKKRFEEANSKVTSLIQKNPKQSVYYNLKALLQLIDKNLTGAEQSFLSAIELNPENSQAYIGLAKLAFEEKRYKQARQYANKVLEINPYTAIAYQLLADVTMQQQGIDAVETLLLDAHLKVKDNPKADQVILQSLAKVYISKKQPEKILQIATDLVEQNKNDIFSLSYLAEAQLVNKENTKAEQTLRQIIKLNPKDAKHLFILARILAEQKDKETEVLSLLDTAALNMDNPVLVLSYKASVLIKMKQYKQALVIAKQVEKLNSAVSIGKILEGDINLLEKKYEEALQNYQQAYQKTPDIKILDGILKIFAIQKKSKDAVELLEKELAKKKDNLAIQFRLAVAYQNSEQNDLSIHYYEAVLAKDENNVIALNNLAWVYSLKKNPKALEMAELAFKLAPKSGAIADTYGYILLKNGNKKESLIILKQAAELDPTLTEIQLHLAEAFILNQDKPKAKEILQKIISNEASDDKVAANKLMSSL